ncbi:MAG: YcxB family protein [Devosiaceae bacterium]|nr:YcxB family protein [Devosiaceae bacterium]
MKLEYMYSFSEYKAINNALQLRKKFQTLRKFLFWGLVIANVSLSLWVMYISLRFQVFLGWLTFANLAIAIAALAWRYVLLPYWVRRYYNMQMLDGKKTQVNIVDEGIETVTDNVRGHYNWQAFIGANEEMEHFVIWVNNAQAICIPKRAFKHKEQQDDFKKIIAENIENHELLI